MSNAVTREVRVAKRGTSGVELGVAVVAGVLASSWIVFAVAWLVAYLVFLWVFPLRKCPRCSGSKFRGDGGEMLRKRKCRRCHAEGVIQRLPAKLIGWGAPEPKDEG